MRTVRTCAVITCLYCCLCFLHMDAFVPACSVPFNCIIPQTYQCICVDVHWCACLHWFVLFYVCLVNIVTGPDKQVMYSILILGGLLSSLWLGLAHQTVRESESDTNYAETLGICFLNLTYQGVAFSPMHHL